MRTEAVLIFTWVGSASDHRNGGGFPLVSMETIDRASATPSNKARPVGLFLELLCSFYLGKSSHLRFYHCRLVWQRKGRAVQRDQAGTWEPGLWSQPAPPDGSPPEQPACRPGVPGVVWGAHGLGSKLPGAGGGES